MVNLQDSFLKHIETNLSFLMEGKLLIAISGGKDSVALAHLCKMLKLNFSLAHCNFNLRGEESDEDEEFVLQLAEDLDVETFVESFDTEVYAKEHKLSIQVAARELRYLWFGELSNQLHFDYILTAHHADDDLETFFINLSRGTGLEGLSGIPEQNGKLVRPLLPFSREEIEGFIKNNHLKWREDSSNASVKYLRNKLRHEIIPKLKEINPQFLQNFIKTQEHLQESKQLIEGAMEIASKDVIEKTEDGSLYFNIEKIKKFPHPKAYVYELLKDYGFTEWNDVVDLLDAQTGKYVLSETHKLLKNREYLILSENNPRIPIEITVQEGETHIETPLGLLTFEPVETLGPLTNKVIYVDKDLLKFPLIVRDWQNGDYFYPFGMQGRKKLSKFFKDEKLSTFEKEKVYVLSDQTNVVWIVQMRPDDRYKVTQKTQNILKIQVRP